MKTRMGTRPFRDGDTFATFRVLVEATVRELDTLDNEYVLKASPTELAVRELSQIEGVAMMRPYFRIVA
jgi:hypothetical protein